MYRRDKERKEINHLLVSSTKNPANTGCNKIIAPYMLYTKKGIFYFCNRSNRLIYMYLR